MGTICIRHMVGDGVGVDGASNLQGFCLSLSANRKGDLAEMCGEATADLCCPFKSWGTKLIPKSPVSRCLEIVPQS